MVSEVHTLNNVIYKDPVYGDIIKIFYVLDDIQFGVDSNKHWLQLKDRNKNINRLRNDMIINEVNDSMLSLLEINIDHLKETLKKSLKMNNISTILVETFPYELIILNGLYSESDWWVSLSMDWFSNIPVKSNYNYEPIIFMLEKIKNNKAYNQNIRHKANKALVRSRQPNS